MPSNFLDFTLLRLCVATAFFLKKNTEDNHIFLIFARFMKIIKVFENERDRKRKTCRGNL